MTAKRTTADRFHIADAEAIRAGRVTDVYFERTREILRARQIDRHVVMEARARRLPYPEGWGLFCGLEELIHLLEGMPLDLWALPEGTLHRGNEPVLLISCDYREFSVYETALLGFLCQASGVATKAARCVIAADGRPVFSFGARRMHPAIAPMIERSAYVGGCAGVATVMAAELLDEIPSGTIPHALVLLLGDSTSATLAFDEIIDKQIQRVALVDTFSDEKFEALENAKLLDDDIYAVRLDTTSSRRGDMHAIASEVRWELDIHGHSGVKIFVSGGLTELDIPGLNDVVDAYGVGTAISNAPVIDYSLDIVEIEGERIAKRGKESGAKQLDRCPACGRRVVRLFAEEAGNCPACGATLEPQLVQYLRAGELIEPLPLPKEIRQAVLQQLPDALG